MVLVRATFTSDSDVGAVRLVGARVGGGINCDGVHVRNSAGRGIFADGLVAGNLSLRGAKVHGADRMGIVRLLSARIGGQAEFDHIELDNTAGDLGIQLQNACVDGALFLPVDAVCRGAAHGRTCDGSGRIGVDKLVYGKLAEDWRGCLHLLCDHTPTCQPATFQQLAAAQRAEGHNGAARRILIAQNRQQLRCGSDAGRWTSDAVVPMGVGPYRGFRIPGTPAGACLGRGLECGGNPRVRCRSCG